MGIRTRRVIWDISVIAYLVNREWFEEKEVSCPDINEDLIYHFYENDRKIHMVMYLNADKIYEDLFKKLKQ